MRLFEPDDCLEEQEELLRNKINALSDEQKKIFYRQQSKLIKDPDTYASLNWMFLGGVHHFYLRKYKIFALEISLLTISIISLIAGFDLAILILVAMTLYEAPQLFFSQKIARQYNYDVSERIYNELTSY